MTEEAPVTRAEIDEMVDRIERVETSIRELRAYAREKFEEDTLAHSALQKQVNGLAFDVGELKADLEALKKEMGEQTASLARIEAAVVPIAKQFGGLLANPRVRVFGSLVLGLLIAWLAARTGIRLP